MSIIPTIFTHVKYSEVLARRIIYSSEKLLKILEKSNNSMSRGRTKKSSSLKDSKNRVFDYIESLGISNGDILIVHSSMESLLQIGMRPKEVLDFLLNLVGDNGTLVLPAFPYYEDNFAETLEYNPKEQLCWTGMLPNVFLRKYGAIRSAFPIDSLAARGKEAEIMMKDNLLGDLPHGKHSSWEYCVNRHAKVLCLGVHAAHCLSLLHLPEEYLDDGWPIKNWFEQRNAQIILPEREIQFSFRSARHHWCRYLNTYYVIGYLRKKNYIVSNDIANIPIEFVQDSYFLTEHLIKQVKNGILLSHSIPRKYWKTK